MVREMRESALSKLLLASLSALWVCASPYVSLATSPGVVAWGSNSEGETTLPIGLTTVTAVAGGLGHGLALRSNGTVLAWGRNDRGQQDVPPGLTGVTAVAAGADHCLALRNDGSVVAWGRNDFGQSTVPLGLTNVRAIAGGAIHSLALLTDGTVVAWGSNAEGQADVPSGLTNVFGIACGNQHSMALVLGGTVVAWGNNSEGQRNVPATLTNAAGIAAGSQHSLAIRSNGTVVAWGRNFEGEAIVPSGLTNVVSVAGGAYHSLAVRNDGTVVAWGRNSEGQASVPTGLTNVSVVTGGGFFSLALVPELAPRITLQPSGAAISVTSSGGFSVTAVGTAPLTYQWWKDGVALLAATGPTLILSNSQTNQAGNYSVVITNLYGSVTSSVAALMINRLGQNLSFGSLPTKNEGDPPFVLMVTNSSGLPVVFTSSDPAVATVTDNTLTVVGVGTATITAIHYGSSTYLPVSVSRVLMVSGAPPLLNTQPTSRAVNATSSTVIFVSGAGSALLNYQWFGLTASLSGATGTAFVAGGFVFDAQVVSGGTGYVQVPAVRFVGGGGSGATATATVSSGAVVAITIVSPGSGYTSPPSVQIDPPSGFLAGQTNATLTLTNVSTNDAGTYFVVVTNAYGSVTSNPATLTVNVPVAVTQSPQGLITTLGSNVAFTVGASGTMPLSHQWFWKPAMSRTALAVSDVRNGFLVGATVLYGGGYYSSPPAVQILGGGSGASVTATVNNGVVSALNIVSPGSGYPSNAVIQIAPPVAGTTQLLSGQTGATLSLPGVGSLVSGSYFVVITNAGGSVTSSPALLRVLVPQRFIQPPQRLGDGSFRLLFGAHDGTFLLTNDLADLEVWGSTNVASTNAWLRITNGITVTNGQVQVDDADSPGLSRRFYRVLTK